MRTIAAAPTKASTTVSSAAAGLASSFFPAWSVLPLLSAAAGGTSVAAISGERFTFTPACGIRTRQRLTGACGA